MARISVVGIGAVTTSVAASATVAVPNGVQTNDVIVIVVSSTPSGTAGTADTVTITGYTQLGATSRREIGTNDASIRALRKVVTNSVTESMAPTVSVGTANAVAWMAYAIVLRNVDTSVVIDATPVTSNGVAASTFTPAGITTVTANAAILTLAVSGDDNGFTLSTPNGHALLASYKSASSIGHTSGSAFLEKATVGAVTMPVFSETAVGPDAWAALCIAFRPSAETFPLHEPFNGPQSTTAWPSAWTKVTGSVGSVASVPFATGRQVLSAIGTYSDWLIERLTATDDIDVLASIEVRNDVESYIWLEHRVTRNSQVDGTGYFIELDPLSNWVSVGKEIGGSQTIFLSHASLPVVVGDVMHTRFQITGSSPVVIRFKFWKNQDAEPTAWALDTTDTSIISGTNFEAVFYGGGPATSGLTTYYRSIEFTSSSVPSVSAALTRKDGLGSVNNVLVPRLSAVGNTAMVGVGDIITGIPSGGGLPALMTGAGSIGNLPPQQLVFLSALAGIGTLSTEIPQGSKSLTALPGIGSVGASVGSLTALLALLASTGSVGTETGNVLTAGTVSISNGVGLIGSSGAGQTGILAVLNSTGVLTIPVGGTSRIGVLSSLIGTGTIPVDVGTATGALVALAALGSLGALTAGEGKVVPLNAVTGVGGFPPLGAASGVGALVGILVGLAQIRSISSSGDVFVSLPITFGTGQVRSESAYETKIVPITALSGLGVVGVDGSSVGQTGVLSVLNSSGSIAPIPSSSQLFSQLSVAQASGEIQALSWGVNQFGILVVLTGLGSIGSVLTEATQFAIPVVIQTTIGPLYVIEMIVHP